MTGGYSCAVNGFGPYDGGLLFFPSEGGIWCLVF